MLNFNKLTSNITQFFSKGSKNWLLGISKSVLLYLLIFLVSTTGWIALSNFIPEILPPAYGIQYETALFINHTNQGINLKSAGDRIFEGGRIYLTCTLQGYRSKHDIAYFAPGARKWWRGYLSYGDTYGLVENAKRGTHQFAVREGGNWRYYNIQVVGRR